MLVFNALILYPLDGYNIIYTLLSFIYEDEFIYDILKYLSLINFVLILIITLIFKSIILGIILIILIYKYIKNKQNHQLLSLKNKQIWTKYFYFYRK